MWFKGKIIPRGDAKVGALSPTAQFGLNVFEGLRGYWNPDLQQLYIFRLSDHLDRLAQSCKLIGLEMPYTADQITKFICDLVRASNYREDIALRLTLFVDGDDTWSSTATPDLFIAPVARARKDVARLPLQTATVSTWRRIDDLSLSPRIKCGANYINSRYAHLDARRKGFDLPIFLNSENKVSEGGGACVFLVRKNVLITSDGTSAILEGLTRNALLVLAKEIGIPCEERRIDRTELLIADEVFLCGSAAEISPVSAIDHIRIGEGKAGPITAALAAEYIKAASRDNSSHHEWTFPVY